VQPEVAKWTRTCSYNHAGTGFSDPGPMPRTSVHIADELGTPLHHGGIGGPYILVGSQCEKSNIEEMLGFIPSRALPELFAGEARLCDSTLAEANASWPSDGHNQFSCRLGAI
jgi:hypothetical protein